ncbi:MAG: transcription antitermination factor NusB [Clostridia bacterium]|nr:transcription antitermination factor NusB [Clostridia bacterium]
MTRSTMREHIFKLLFRAPFIDKNDYEEQIELYFADADMVDASTLKEEEYNYIKDKTLAIAELIPQLDERIDSVSEGWPTSRLGKTELSIMRLAVYEMLYDDDIPVNVAIDEAVELAKKYGSADNTAAFVNGVLAKLIKE